MFFAFFFSIIFSFVSFLCLFILPSSSSTLFLTPTAHPFGAHALGSFPLPLWPFSLGQDCLGPRCRNKQEGGFVLSARQLPACISSLPILPPHPRCHAFRNYPAVFLNTLGSVESVLGRFLCSLMLAKEAVIYLTWVI